MAIHFYYSPMSSAMRIHWALEELGVPFEKHKIDLQKGEQRAADFLAINPNGKVPALVDGDAKIFESVAILIHLGDTYGESKGLWPKRGTPEHGEALSWTVWGTTELGPSVVAHMLNTSDRPWAFPKEHRSAHAAEHAKGMWKRALEVLDKRLAGRDYILGKSFTLVDVATASLVGFGAMMGGLSLDGAANVAAWLPKCQQRPAMARSMAG